MQPDLRAVHGITLAFRQGHAGNEDLRQAMVHYRALFDRLLDSAPADEPDVVIDVRERERKASAGGSER
jgi:hypothetical protein